MAIGRILIIDRCNDCPKLYKPKMFFGRSSYYCTLTGREIENKQEIHNSCTLKKSN